MTFCHSGSQKMIYLLSPEQAVAANLNALWAGNIGKHDMKTPPKPSCKTPWKTGHGGDDRGSAGQQTTWLSGHPSACQTYSHQLPTGQNGGAGQTTWKSRHPPTCQLLVSATHRQNGGRSCLRYPFCPPEDQVGQGTKGKVNVFDQWCCKIMPSEKQEHVTRDIEPIDPVRGVELCVFLNAINCISFLWRNEDWV